MSLDADKRAFLRRLLGLISLAVRIYGYIQAAHRSGCEGDFIGIPFYAATCCQWDAVHATRSKTVGAEKN